MLVCFRRWETVSGCGMLLVPLLLWWFLSALLHIAATTSKSRGQTNYDDSFTLVKHSLVLSQTDQTYRNLTLSSVLSVYSLWHFITLLSLSVAVLFVPALLYFVLICRRTPLWIHHHGSHGSERAQCEASCRKRRKVQGLTCSSEADKISLVCHTNQTKKMKGSKQEKQEAHQEMRQRTWTFYDDILHVLQSTIHSCIYSGTDICHTIFRPTVNRKQRHNGKAKLDL